MFDTGVVVSALVFPRGRLAWLRREWRERRSTPLVSRGTVEELLRVFAYPKFRLSPEERNELLAEYLPVAVVIVMPRRLPRVPACRDADDRKFLQLAAAGSADALVTGDGDLLELAEAFDVPILRPEAWRTRAGAA